MNDYAEGKKAWGTIAQWHIKGEMRRCISWRCLKCSWLNSGPDRTHLPSLQSCRSDRIHSSPDGVWLLEQVLRARTAVGQVTWGVKKWKNGNHNFITYLQASSTMASSFRERFVVSWGEPQRNTSILMLSWCLVAWTASPGMKFMTDFSYPREKNIMLLPHTKQITWFNRNLGISHSLPTPYPTPHLHPHQLPGRTHMELFARILPGRHFPRHR